MILIAPSLLACDFSRIGEEVKSVMAAGADWLHLDIMDGHFVPNLTIGPDVVYAVRELTDDAAIESHLMVEYPTKFVNKFADSGSDIITFHVECKEDPAKVIEAIKATGVEVGISLKPGTDVEAIKPYLDDVDMVLVMTVEPGFGGQSFMTNQVEKIKRIHELVGPDKYLAVDGGVCLSNAGVVAGAGANVLISGTSIFGQDNRREAISRMREQAEIAYTKKLETYTEKIETGTPPDAE